MSDNTDATQDATEESTTNSQSAVNSSYKVLGEFTNTSGAGVLGQNNASGGTPIGVQGAVPKNTDGYGLYTKNDAKIEGSLELTDALTTSGDYTHQTSGGNFVVKTSTSGISILSTESSEPTVGGILMGGGENKITDGAEGATISGGGDVGDDFAEPNRVHDNFGTVAGGAGNDAGSPADDDPSTAQYATVAGGRGNTADGAYSFAAGRKADASGNDGAFVWGDSSTTAVTAGATDQVRFQASGGFVVENTTQFQITDGLPGGSGTPVEIDSNGLLVESANVSSVRYKTDIEPLEPTPGAVLELEPRSFVYEETGDEDVGFLAEEADECVPELVGYDEEGRPDSIHYDRIGVFLLPEVRRNRERIEELEEQVSGESVAEEGTEASQSELDRKDDRIADLEAELSQKDERIDELAERLAEKDERMADLEDRLAAVETQVGNPATPADD